MATAQKVKSAIWENESKGDQQVPRKWKKARFSPGNYVGNPSLFPRYWYRIHEMLMLLWEYFVYPAQVPQKCITHNNIFHPLVAMHNIPNIPA